MPLYTISLIWHGVYCSKWSHQIKTLKSFEWTPLSLLLANTVDPSIITKKVCYFIALMCFSNVSPCLTNSFIGSRSHVAEWLSDALSSCSFGFKTSTWRTKYSPWLMLVFCILRVQGTAIFTGSSQETLILLHSHNMRQDKSCVKICGARGPVCSPYTELMRVPKLNPPVWQPATIAASHSLDVRTHLPLSLSQSFTQLCLSQDWSSSQIVTLTTPVCTLQKSERARKASGGDRT